MRYAEPNAQRPEHLKNTPAQRIREPELQSLFLLYAMWDGIEKLVEKGTLDNRLRSIPGGLRDLRMLRAKFEHLINDLMWTVPDEKVQGVARTIRRMRYNVSQGPIASRTEYKDEQLVSAQELVALVDAAHEYKCKLCFEGNCKQCALGKAFHNLVAYDLGDGRWSDVDISGGVA